MSAQKESIMNDAKLLELYRWAEKQDQLRQEGLPNEWVQATYLADTTRWSEQMRQESVVNGFCGTACCLAGKTVLDAGGVAVGRTMVMLDGRLRGVSNLAADVLGLNDDQQFLLFAGGNDLDDIRYILTRWGVFDRMGESS